ELFNTGDTVVDLTGWVLDDNNNQAYTSANIAGGSVPAGGTAILFNSSLAAEDFAAVWGEGINLVPVSGWTRLSLNNGGDTIGLWASFDDYAGDHQSHARAVLSLAYAASAPWPRNADGVSIYLTDLAADPANGANWALSVPDTVTPAGTVYTSRDG
ncbi:lamin tail domain-containing protein, partial [Arthrospira platensis SPKY2]